MADDLDPKERHKLANDAKMIQQAFRERDEAVFGMKKLTSVLQTTRTDLHSYKEKNNTYELLLLRDECHIKKLKQLVSEKEREISKLRNAVRDSERDIDDDIETDAVEPEPYRTTRSKESDDENSEGTSTEKAIIYGISHEIYEQLLRDHIQLKKELENLLEKEKLNPIKYLESEEKKILIIQLETSNNELKKKVKKLENDLQEMIDTINSEPVSSKSKVIDLSQQLKSLQEKYRQQEILFHCMEDKCHDLGGELLKLKQSRKDDVKSADSKKDSKESKRSADAKADDLNGTLSTDYPIDQQLKDLEFRNGALATSLTTSQQQNQVLSERLKSAEVKSQINEQRYRELLRTLKENKPEIDDKCEKWSEKDKQIEELKKQIEKYNQVNGNLNAQLTVYQEEDKQSRQETINMKKRHEFEIDQWKENYGKMSKALKAQYECEKCSEKDKQIEELKKQIEKYNQVNGNLNAQLKEVNAKLQAKMRIQTVSEPYQCSWADSMNKSMHCYAVDVCDEVAVPSTHRHPPSAEVRFQDTPATLECPRCKREFPPSQVQELQVHVSRCLDD